MENYSIPEKQKTVESKALPNFPTPYPDECFYSILCRACVRNGYYSDQKFLLRLFGRPVNIRHTVLAPFGAGFAGQWLRTQNDITPETIIKWHTCAPYGSILYDTETLDRILSPEETSEVEKAQRMKRFRTLCTPDFLRYCPLCVIEDIECYGEPYWHRVHQIKEVRYCPKHKVRLKNSTVSLSSYIETGYHFYPASSVLHSYFCYGMEQASREIDESILSVPDSKKALHTRISESIAWLLGHPDECFSAPCQSERIKLWISRNFPDQSASAQNKELRALIANRFPEHFILEITNKSHMIKNPSFLFSDARKYTAIPPLLYLITMDCLGGSVENFISKTNFSDSKMK